MSNPLSALNGATWSDGIASVVEVPMQGMITLRGDLSDPVIKAAATAVASVDVPGQGHANCDDSRGICWMSPDELLVLCSYEDVAANLEKMQSTLDGVHSLCVDVSDARAVFEVSGPYAREVLAKLAPVDLAPDQFTKGMFRRTRMAQVPAAFWLQDTDCFRIICFRSHAQYVFDLLTVAAQKGSAVDLF
ncbi:sarcosine oxidase subunit gamma family protein [Tateyamaria sp. ANG-S1]|uniref:sarcosine oxidase subunit gamma n=1 Tax=Tateyamaria sp. ANG-S1 TaxID=1577905 RepID=UPI00057D8661|nr:sarcosine oxidase subunit gamma family protein [Tateyamaria sp. ANG-S1]KIC51312.1 sarcosine oxidase subunit gamma [Tateyamaria sp. ANG-S1]